MAQPYVGEIRMFAGNFAPAGWMFCAGQLLPISENETLFQLIGTTYGGDGQSTFALPNLSSRVPIHQGNGFVLADTGGVESVTLTVNQIPLHNHTMIASGDPADQITGNNGVVATPPSLSMYFTAAADTALNPNAMTMVGGSQPHSNIQPYGSLYYIISLFGIFPSPT